MDPLRRFIIEAPLVDEVVDAIMSFVWQSWSRAVLWLVAKLNVYIKAWVRRLVD